MKKFSNGLKPLLLLNMIILYIVALVAIFYIVLAGVVSLLISINEKNHKKELKKAEKILQGYSLRREDVYMEISPERVIEQAILYKMSPNDTVIWKRFTDGTAEQLRDLSEWTTNRELSKAELDEIEKEVAEYVKNLPRLRTFGDSSGVYAICSGFAVWDMTGQRPLSPEESFRRKLVDERSLIWKKSAHCESILKKDERFVEKCLTSV